MTDFSTYKFRCSALPNLMVKPRNKGDILSQTAMTYLNELWIQEVYGRQKYDTANKYTAKGIQCESDSLDLVSQLYKKTYFKNTKQYENDWITGTPDVVASDLLIDIKTNWDIWSFNKSDMAYAEKTYYAQLLGYMWLTGKKDGEIVFTLIYTPDDIIQDELYRLSFKLPELSTSDDLTNEVKRNYIYDDIPKIQRIKNYGFTYSTEFEEALKEKITAGRAYMNELML